METPPYTPGYPVGGYTQPSLVGYMQGLHEGLHMALMSGPIEAKVTASTIGSALATIVCWILNHYVFDEAMPELIQSSITVVVVTATTFAVGYLTKHTARDDVNAVGPNGRHSQPNG
jgi:hypothetical protein